MVELYNEQAEQIVLGTIIMNNEQYKRIADVLEDNFFYVDINQETYKHISKIINDGGSVNIITVKQLFSNFFIKKGLDAKDGLNYLQNVLNEASTVFDIREYAFLIKENYSKRILLDLLKDSQDDISSKSVVDICDNISHVISKIDADTKEVPLLTTKDMAKALQKNWEEDLGSKAVKTGLPSLDQMMNGGLYPKKLYIIGAAPGTGKTTLAQQIILQGLESKIGCVFISMEMERENVLSRFLGHLSSINPFRIGANKIYKHEENNFIVATEKWEKISKHYMMTDKGNLPIHQIKSTIKRAIRKNKVGLVVVDYVQIIPTREVRNINEASLIKENITTLKEMAKEFNVAILALSQVTKDDTGGKPSMKSLKGSGGIAEGADFVGMMWAKDEDQQNQSNKSLGFAVVKNRNGSMGEISMNYDGEFGRFTEVNNF